VAVETVRRDIQLTVGKPLRVRELPLEDFGEIAIPGEELPCLAGPEGFIVGVSLFVERSIPGVGLCNKRWGWREGAVFVLEDADGGIRHVELPR